MQQDAAVDRALGPLEAVLAADRAIAALEDEASHLEEACAAAVDDADATEALVERLNAVYEKLYDEDASQRRRRAGDVLKGLGFEASMLAIWTAVYRMPSRYPEIRPWRIGLVTIFTGHFALGLGVSSW